MPYLWVHENDAAPDRSGAVFTRRWRLTLWPQRSTGPRGLAIFVGLTAALLGVPMFALLGSPALWVLLAFAVAALAGLILALRLVQRQGMVREDLVLGDESLTLERRRKGAEPLYWQANPHWVCPRLYPSGGPVPAYLTLQGGGREVELGAFLTPEERERLYGELCAALNAAPSSPAAP
ncbi:DUF2244 domain-containing protein [Phaeovulum sp.]|uniref:DUF2244 domain-containing protein n=1 Tax=Phaeovulum sp. TaxID=2934796 RepID=UPI003568843F